MDEIPVHLLNAFVVFGESRNIVEAAARLRITQPALSKQLRQLEEVLPGRIFAMAGRRKTLTPFGQSLHGQLQKRLGHLTEVVRGAWSLHARADQAQVRIAARRGVLDRISEPTRFAGSLFFLEMKNLETIEALRSQSCEIGIVHGVPRAGDLVAKPLFREEFHLVVPKAWLSQRPGWGAALLEQLKSKPCLGYRPHDEILRAVCSSHAVDPRSLRMVRATENYSSLGKMVDAGMGWAVLPAYLEVSKSHNWRVPIPSRLLPERQFHLVYRRELNSVPWFQDLLNEIRAAFEKR